MINSVCLVRYSIESCVTECSTANVSSGVSLGYPRNIAATGNISSTFAPSFPRSATANISSTFAPSFPRAATANISSGVIVSFPRTAGATTNISDTFLPKFPRAATANISSAVVPMFPRSSTATFGDSHTAVKTVIGDLTGTNVQPESLVAGAVGNVDVTFTLANALPADGKIVITLPAGFTISSGGATAIGLAGTSFDGTETVTVSGNVITITRSGGSSLNAGTNITIELTNIKNPATAGSTGTYAIKTTRSDGTIIDKNDAVTADTITSSAAPKKTTPNADVSITHAGSTSDLLVGATQTHTFTVVHNGAGQRIPVTFTASLPTQVSLVSAATTQGSCSGTTKVTCVLGAMGATQTVTVTMVVKIVSLGTAVIVGSVSSNLNDTVPTNNTVRVTTKIVPPLTAALTYEPDRDVRSGETVVVTVTFNRPVTGSPTMSIDTAGVDLSAVMLTATSDPKVWTYSYKVPEDSDGQATVTIGGVASQSNGGNIVLNNNKFNIDSIGALVALTYEPNASVSAGGTLIITATFDREIIGTPTISINTTGTDLTPVAMTKTGDNKVWTYSYVVPANSDGDAVVTIANGTDSAGNTNKPATNNEFPIGPVKIGVKLSYQPASNIMPGTTVVITATFDCKFTGTPSIGINTQGPDVSGVVMTATGDPLVWVFTYVVSEGTEGLAEVSLSGLNGGTNNQVVSLTNNSFLITGNTTDLSVGVTASVETAVRNGTLTNTITVVNRGPATTTRVTLVNDLPGDVTLNSVAPGSVDCNVVSGSVICDLGTLAQNQAAVVLIDVTVSADAEGILVNRSSVSGSEVDPTSVMVWTQLRRRLSWACCPMLFRS